jgi:hypothetical protein
MQTPAALLAAALARQEEASANPAETAAFEERDASAPLN